MSPWWLTLVLFAVFTAIGEIFRPKLQDGAPQASGLGEFQVPTAEENRAIPVVFGTTLVRGPNVTWYGDLRVVPITKKVKTGLFSSEKITIGYRYFLGMQLALCQGVVDVFRGIRFADKIPAYTSATVGDKLQLDMGSTSFNFGTFTFNPNMRLFGGDEQEGGVAGLVDFHYGGSAQAASDYLQAKITANLPAYRSVSYAVLRQCYVGTSPYIKEIAVELSRFPNPLGLTAGKHIIATYDCNPANALYEILTNTEWGCAIPTGLVDLTSFQAAGNTLHGEGLGISLQHATADEAAGLISEIERHIDGVIYTDLSTGIIKLVLARKDYVEASLPVLDETQVSNVKFSRPAWSELANVVRVTYISRADNYTERTVQQMNLAAIQIMGDRVVEDIPFRAFSQAAPTNATTARALKTLSFPLGRLEIAVDRTAWDYPPGKVFKLNWEPLGIVGMICRVSRPEYGLLEDGEITLHAVEDIFAIAATAFTPPGSSGWVDPVGNPAAASQQAMIEAPYHLVGAADRHALTLIARAAGSDVGYEVWSDRAGGTAYAQTNNVNEFTPTGVLTASYAANTAALDATGFTVNAGVDLAQLASVSTEERDGGVNLALIDQEIVAFKTVVDNLDGSYTIRDLLRGVLDTVPAAHSSSARVWFLMPPGAGVVDPSNPYGVDGTVTAKALPFNQRGILPIASATQLSLALASRALKPYPPGNVKVDAIAWPTTRVAGVDIVLTWAHRHRVTQAADLKVVAQDAGDYVATPEGDYTVKVFVGAVLKRTVPAIAGTTWTWTAAMQAADSGVPAAVVEIQVIPVSGALTGTLQTRTFTLT